VPKLSALDLAYEALQAKRYAQLEAIVADPMSSNATRARAIGSLNAVDRKVLAADKAKRKKVNARRSALKAERAQEAHKVMLAGSLPDNGRYDQSWKPTAQVAPWRPPGWTDED
jgi:hypothetical protein